MSYMQFQQKCRSCGAEWNAAFGIVGTQQIAAPPQKCPKCGSLEIAKLADGWKTDLPFKEIPTMTTLQRIEQSQGAILAAVNAAIEAVGRVEQRLGHHEEENTLLVGQNNTLQGRVDAMETVLTEQVRQQGQNFDVLCLILRILDAYSHFEFAPLHEKLDKQAAPQSREPRKKKKRK